MTTEEIIFNFLEKFYEENLTYLKKIRIGYSYYDVEESSTVLKFKGDYEKELLLLKNKILQNRLGELTKGGGSTENTTPFSIVEPLQDRIPCQVQTFANNGKTE